MGGNFPSVHPGGALVAYGSPEQAPGRVAYGENDDPEIVGRGLVETDGAGGIFSVSGGRNLRSVTVVGTEVRIELTEDQAGSAQRYPVVLTSMRVGAAVADTQFDYTDGDARTFFVGARTISTGIVIDLSVTVVRFTFAVLRV